MAFTKPKKKVEMHALTAAKQPHGLNGSPAIANSKSNAQPLAANATHLWRSAGES